jgi:hypothetical protein
MDGWTHECRRKLDSVAPGYQPSLVLFNESTTSHFQVLTVAHCCTLLILYGQAASGARARAQINDNDEICRAARLSAPASVIHNYKLGISAEHYFHSLQ